MLEYLPAALPPFLALNPNIDIDLEEMKSPEVMRLIAANRADIGIVAGPIDPALQLETFPFASNLARSDYAATAHIGWKAQVGICRDPRP
jgi:DNA-binding transcriptional LysR family regulator